MYVCMYVYISHTYNSCTFSSWTDIHSGISIQNSQTKIALSCNVQYKLDGVVKDFRIVIFLILVFGRLSSLSFRTKKRFNAASFHNNKFCIQYESGNLY